VLFIARASTTMVCGKQCGRKRQSRVVAAGIMRRYRDDPEFRDLVKSKEQNRRVSKLGQPGITEPAHVLATLYVRDDGICGICRRPVTDDDGPGKPSIDHVIPLRYGGRHEMGNLQLAHYRCNLIKHDRIVVWCDRAGYEAWAARAHAA
jgi:hypothetical protein